MSPTIRSGDTIVVGPTCTTTLKPDDVALFVMEGRLYAHRFVGWRRTREGQPALEFCGDATTESDPLVGVEDVIGVVLRVESPQTRPGLGRAWARTGERRRTALAMDMARTGYRALSRAFAAIAIS